MSTRKLAFGGVICALSSVCIIFSSLFHLIFPLVIMCAFFYLCAYKCGNLCALLVIITSNIIGFIVGGIGGGEILFSLLLFSPYSIIIYSTRGIKGKLWLSSLRAIIFAAFSCAMYILFVTVLKGIVGFNEFDFKIGTIAFGVIFVVVMTLFGFALDTGAQIITKRFFKND